MTKYFIDTANNFGEYRDGLDELTVETESEILDTLRLGIRAFDGNSWSFTMSTTQRREYRLRYERTDQYGGLLILEEYRQDVLTNTEDWHEHIRLEVRV